MADKKISELVSLTGANAATGDLLPIVDVSATETKKITRQELFSSVPSLTTTGNVTIGGDLTVNGTTTTINTQTLDVEDKNITIAFGSPDAAAANGAGLTVDGANATLTYVSAGDNWALNKPLNVTGNISLTGTVDGRDIAADGSIIDGLGTISTQDANTVNIDGGTIDGTVIGGSTPAAISGTTGTFSGLTVDTDAIYAVSGTNRVGINNSSPATALDVGGSIFFSSILRSTTGGSAAFPSIQPGPDADTGIFHPASNNIGFTTLGTERMRITSTGNVGIGTSSPSAALDVLNGSGDGEVAVFSGTDSDRGLSISTFAVSGFGQTGVDLNAQYSSSPTMTLSTGGTERMRITSTGLVGIGTSSPSAKTQIVSNDNTTTAGLRTNQLSVVNSFAATGTAGASASLHFNVINGTTNHVAGISAIDTGGNSTFATDLALYTRAGAGGDAAERMRIDSSGNLLVGTTSTTASTTGFKWRQDLSRLLLVADGAAAASFGRLTSNGDVVFIQKDGTTVGSISVTASTTAYNTSSDYRLKENVVPLAGAADRLAQIPVHRFNFIADPDTTVDGFLAHEVQAFVPEAVTGEKDAVDKDGKPVHQGIDQSKLVPLLTAALQEALQKIEALEARITALEA